MDIVFKLTLVASIIMIGYNLHSLFTSYKNICEKVKTFKRVALENDADEKGIQLSNTILTAILSLVFIILIYLSGFAYWVVCCVIFKMILSLKFSYMEISQIFKNDSIDSKLFYTIKVDSVINILVGLCIAFLVVL